VRAGALWRRVKADAQGAFASRKAEGEERNSAALAQVRASAEAPSLQQAPPVNCVKTPVEPVAFVTFRRDTFRLRREPEQTRKAVARHSFSKISGRAVTKKGRCTTPRPVPTSLLPTSCRSSNPIAGLSPGEWYRRLVERDMPASKQPCRAAARGGAEPGTHPSPPQAPPPPEGTPTPGVTQCFRESADKRANRDCARGLVRVVGLEPTLLAEPDFESGASTNFTTPATAFVTTACRLAGHRKSCNHMREMRLEPLWVLESS
jgi:hypothetical protein